ncbi:MAG: hypothetical protein EZS28_014577 [Streblomastix strix]|uniref:Uncharacterized protein n=1 Tax=Streblomastix strix TaxID=222440 RepID=A0A5J4W5Q6_9EUKA|nr:MAG: hypothetical protein EZS28_014577 [Streblomastix strix]
MEEIENKAAQGAGGQSGVHLGGFMEIDGDDDYDYYETQPIRQDRIKAKAKPFGLLPLHLSLIQRTRKHAGSQMREEAGDVLAILVSYLNRDIKKINILSSAVSARQYIADKYLEKNAIYSVDGYTTAVGFSNPEHYHKRN